MAEKILIVDDERHLVILLETAIKQSLPSATVSVASNGKQALQMYEKEGADLIILDHRMPLMNGPELTRVLRSRGETVPIVMISGDFTVGKEAYTAGATLFVATLELLQKLPEILARFFP
ncbi:MAG TPA: response regulator [Anaerolineae bacterium]|nr:response regulator [Anaerolineae bacterium]HXV97330.1 response regulator [Anaerolineae bacterium]